MCEICEIKTNEIRRLHSTARQKSNEAFELKRKLFKLFPFLTDKYKKELDNSPYSFLHDILDNGFKKLQY